MQVKCSRVKRHKVSNDTGWNVHILTSLLIGLHHTPAWAYPSENTAGEESLNGLVTGEELERNIHRMQEHHTNRSQEHHISMWTAGQTTPSKKTSPRFKWEINPQKPWICLSFWTTPSEAQTRWSNSNYSLSSDFKQSRNPFRKNVCRQH